ncbi:MAG: hypothetical protein GWP19_02655 [Planctomycetia bacterium]|nr:hypothetical protein [Planctomycetia bacterium]
MNEELQEKIDELEEKLDELNNSIQIIGVDMNTQKEELSNEVAEILDILSQHKHILIDNTKKLGILFPITEHLQGVTPATAANYGTIFINKSDKEYIVKEIQVVWGTASTSGTLQVERLQGTEVKDAGDDLLSATIDMSATANTVTKPVLTSTIANLKLAKNDRLGLVNGGTLTSQADLVITIYLQEL